MCAAAFDPKLLGAEQNKLDILLVPRACVICVTADAEIRNPIELSSFEFVPSISGAHSSIAVDKVRRMAR